MLTRRSMLLGPVVSGLASSLSAWAQSYPTRTVKIVVPFAPGTSGEIVIRPLAEHLAARFKQPFIVENRPGGAGGTVGAAAVAAADPDGHTLLATPPGPLVTAAAMYRNLSYDPATLVPVALLFESPQLLAVHPSTPAMSLAELIRHAKAHPRSMNFASPGYGTQPHLLGEMLRTSTGIDIVHVPYKSPAAALTELLAGQVQMCFETSPLVVPQVQAGKLRVLAVAGGSRLQQLPDVPTTGESGLPELRGGFWSGLVAPPGTPGDIVATINAAVNEAMRSQEMQARLEALGAKQRSGTPSEFRDFIADETRRWTEIIRSLGVRID